MKNFRFDTIRNITQEAQDLLIVPVGSSTSLSSLPLSVIKYHQLLSIIYINS